MGYVMVIRVPFEVNLEDYPPGTTPDEAAEMNRKSLEDLEFGIDEFVGETEVTFEVEED